jgi:hypothetical protein
MNYTNEELQEMRRTNPGLIKRMYRRSTYTLMASLALLTGIVVAMAALSRYLPGLLATLVLGIAWLIALGVLVATVIILVALIRVRFWRGPQI